MIVQLCIPDGQLLYDVVSLDELIKRASVHFLIQPLQQRLRLTYRVPDSPAVNAQFATIEIATEDDLRRANEVWYNRIRPVQLARQEALLPTFFAEVVPRQNTYPQQDNAVRKNRAPPNKSAAPTAPDAAQSGTFAVQDAPATVLSASTLAGVSPVRTGAEGSSYVDNSAFGKQPQRGPVDTDWYKSHDFALQLLASFKDPNPDDGPTIRVTLRGGQCSCRIPFNAYNRPDAEVLKRSVQAALLARLPPEEQTRVLQGTATSALQFLLYANTPTSDVDIDVDDNSDVALLCEEIKAINRDRDVPDDFTVQLVAEWVLAEDVPQVRTDPRFVTTDLVDEVVLPPRSALSVNLAHTPKRERHEVKSFAPDDE